MFLHLHSTCIRVNLVPVCRSELGCPETWLALGWWNWPENDIYLKVQSLHIRALGRQNNDNCKLTAQYQEAPSPFCLWCI
jgi:hypothetical protein